MKTMQQQQQIEMKLYTAVNQMIVYTCLACGQ